MEAQFKYSTETGAIIGCGMTVHTALGNGFQEVIYQRALALKITWKPIIWKLGS